MRQFIAGGRRWVRAAADLGSATGSRGLQIQAGHPQETRL